MKQWWDLSRHIFFLFTCLCLRMRHMFSSFPFRYGLLPYSKSSAAKNGRSLYKSSPLGSHYCFKISLFTQLLHCQQQLFLMIRVHYPLSSRRQFFHLRKPRYGKVEGPAQNPTVVRSKVQLRGKRMTNGLPTGGHPRVM